MKQRVFDPTMEIEFRLIPTGDGGRPTPIISGYRPNVIVKTASGDEVIFGLAELELSEPAQPGASGKGVLRFDESISQLVRSHLKVGTEFAMSEAKWVVASARVLSIS